MKEFRGKVAVITGAASGIGLGLARRCVQEGMKVVLADIEEAALSSTYKAFKADGADVLAVVTDVSQEADVADLARKTLDAYGAVHLLCNNAGVAAGSTIWESSLNDWEWVMGVNLWGVIHCLRIFVPLMLAQESDSHIVNTASVAGLISNYPSAPYQATKHAVVALSENLYYDMAKRGGRINVSVLCPGYVDTQIVDSWRNRPLGLTDDPGGIVSTPESEAFVEEVRRLIAAGMSPEELADHLFRAIVEEKFYILTHPEITPYIQARMGAIVTGENPPLA